MAVALADKKVEFVLDLIEKGKHISEIIAAFRKKYNKLVADRTIRRIAYRNGAKFAHTCSALNPEMRKELISLISKGKTKAECRQGLLDKFGKSIQTENIRRFARREGLNLTSVSPNVYKEDEQSIIRGLWLVGASQERMQKEFSTRSLASMKKKFLSMKQVGQTSDAVKEAITNDLSKGMSTEKVAKKYKISAKYVKEYRSKLKESSVEIANLKRWEQKDVNELFDLIETAQKKLKNIDSEQGTADITIKTSAKYVALAFMSDFHLENVNTNVSQLRRDFEIIKNTKDFYMGFGGDLIDNFMVGPHKEGVVEAVITPKAARIAAGKLFDMLKGRVLWTIIGCHDAWDRDFADYNLPEHIARKLSIPYMGHGGDVNLKIKHSSGKPILYNIHARHKFRGSSGLNNGTACCKNVLRDIDSKFDIVSIGHNHFAEIKLEHYLGKLRVFIRNGSYKVEDRYSKMLGYQSNPFNIQIPVVLLNTKTKEIKVVSGIENAASTLKALNK